MAEFVSKSLMYVDDGNGNIVPYAPNGNNVNDDSLPDSVDSTYLRREALYVVGDDGKLRVAKQDDFGIDTSNQLNVMSNKYMASGSLQVTTGSINNNSNILTATDKKDFKVGHGIVIQTYAGVKEVATLQITAAATQNGNVTVTLDGATLIVDVVAGDTPLQVANKIRASGSLAASGWGVDANTSATVTFMAISAGSKTDITYSAGSTGAIGIATTTTQGQNSTAFTSKIVEIKGNKLYLRDTYTGSNLTNARTEHDDTEAINQAITDANSKGGGIVLIPASTFLITQIRMKSRVILTGSGWGTRILQRGATNLNTVVLDNPSVEFSVVRDLRIDGQKTLQNSGSGIYYDNTGGSNFSFYDTVHLIENVLVMNVKEHGVFATESREIRMTRVFVFAADGYGYYLTPTDSFFNQCTAASSGLSGWRINAPNSRFSSCKAYGSGRLDSIFNGDGFYIPGHRHNLVNCESQDNGRNGFFIFTGSQNILSSCFSDSNGNKTTASTAGFQVGTGSSDNLIDGHSINRPGYTSQKYGLIIGGDCLGNQIRLICKSNTSGEIFPDQGAGNDIAINNQLGNQTAVYVSTFTPFPYLGGTIFVTLTGNITINAPTPGHHHAGMEMVFILTQDSTGGRTISFSSAYKTNWTPSTASNKINVIKFIYNGFNWVQVLAQTNL